MERVNIIETKLRFTNPLSERYSTDLIVLHHTGSGVDLDVSAAEIHRWHISAGYSGIGYHFIIRKNGVIERGRPIWATGAHAYGENYHTIGIHLSGTFSGNTHPTPEQIEMAAMLIANICADYSIPLDRKHIVGHGELMATDCPGKNLQSRLYMVVGKANWYRYKT